MTTLTPRWRLKPVAIGGAHLARPVAWGVVGLLVVVTLVALFAKTLAPYDPIQPVGALNLPPLSPGHLLGTDGIGRDLLSRTLIGIQVSWLSALVDRERGPSTQAEPTEARLQPQPARDHASQHGGGHER